MGKRKSKLLLKKSLLVVFILVLTLMFSGCNDKSSTTSETPPANSEKESVQTLKELSNQFEELQKASLEYLINTDLGYMTPKEVYEKVVLEGDQSYFVVDVRSPGDFAKGNIEGSVNIPYGVAADPKQIANLPRDKKIIVVCYSGHTANQTVALWAMLGYDAVPMLNGMGGWTATPGLGSPLLKEAFNYPVVKEAPKENIFTLPTIKEDKIFSLEDLIMKRSQNYLSSGKGPIVKPEELMTSNESKDNAYFLVDMRKAEDYKKGHVEGAINIPYQEIAKVENLKKLPTEQKIVVIGYTGNDASQIVRVLNQLGYDSYAMFRGMRVWTSDAEINGIAPISTESPAGLPTKPINVDLDSSGGSASCG